MKKSLSILFLLLSTVFYCANAQTTISTINGASGYTGAGVTQGNSCVTFNVENTNPYPIFLDAVEMFKNATFPGTPTTFTLWYSSTSLTDMPTIAKPVWDSIFSSQSSNLSVGYNTIFNGINFVIPANTQYRFAVQSSNGIAFSGTYYTGCSPNTLSAGGVNLILGEAQLNGTSVGWMGSMPNPQIGPRWFTGSITFSQASLCTSSITAGNAVSSTTTACSGNPFTLSLSGTTQALGMTYQWESSPNGTTGWTPISSNGATKRTFVTSQSVNTFYRCKVSCGATSVYTSSVAVTTPAAVSGNFTINSSIATGGTNFNNFADAINHIACGINGPVKFTVVPGTGPYNEQVMIPHIGGTSSTNTITIVGNGETLTSSTTTAANKAIMWLNGADNVIIDSLAIDGSQGSFGWGVLISNNANGNTVKKCNIILNATAQNSNYVGVLVGFWGTNVLVDNNNNNNSIIDNTVTGGYYSVYMSGDNFNPTGSINNVVKGNTFKDMYGFCIVASYMSSGLVISNNDISRPARTNSVTTAGLNLGQNCWGALIEKNKIHNMFDAMQSNLAQFIGISINGKGRTGQEIKVLNNLIYNISGNGYQNGLAINSDTALVYHNTVVFDDGAAANGQTYGISTATPVSGTEIKNNLIVITRSGIKQKRAISFNNATLSVVCNNNAFYFNPPNGTDNYFGQIGVQLFATLQDWKTTAGYDAQSDEGDPAFVSSSTGDFTPTYPNFNDIGYNVGVATDINDASRSLSAPDPGAVEFTITPCSSPIVTGTINSVSNVCSNTSFGLGLLGNSVGAGQTYTYQWSLNGTSNWNNVANPLTNPNISTSQPQTYYYRCKVKCGTDSAYTPASLITSPVLVSGTYTINSGAATGGNNFNNFNDAINHIACGINGPIVFNVLPNSGPYNEKVVIPAIKGTSNANTITINGNGNALTYTAPTTNDRVTLHIKGTDHLNIDYLTIDASSGASAGWAVLFSNQADSNVIKRSTIISSDLATNQNYAGIVFSNTNTSLYGSGNNGNYNRMLNDTITGGYYGAYLYGNFASSTQNNNNTFKDCEIRDFYSAGIYAQGQSSGFMVSHNQFTRPSRTNSGYSTYGVYLSGNMSSVLIEKNRIHNLYDFLPASVGTSFGIYVNAKAKAGFENKVLNNLIYNANNNGPAYGIYNSAGDSMLAYHNTIILDDQATTTGSAYGIYHSYLGNGTQYKNNIVSVTRSGTGIKRCIYVGDAAIKLKCDNNILFLNAATGINNHLGQLGNQNLTTLSAWQSASNFDINSQSIDPAFSLSLVGGYDSYAPTNGVINGLGVDVSVTSDINGKARTNVPDPGAVEIDFAACVNPPIPGTSITTNANVCPNNQFILNLVGNSQGAGQTYQWYRSATGTAGTWSTVGLPSTSATINTIQATTNYYRCGVSCSGGTTVYSTPVLVSSPTSISGAFTIDNFGTPSPTVFLNFTDALKFITCAGMGGAITLNVAPNSGPYNEKIYIPQITGASATNKLIINGSGATLNYASSDPANRTAIILDGANYVIIDSLNVDVTGGTYGWGILLTNQANNNTISNCIVTTNTESTNTNFAGILVNGSTQTFPVSGNNGSNNIISNNTVIGGYHGIALYGNTLNTTQNNANQVTGNTVTDFYAFGIYGAYQSTGFVVKKNDISRPTRTNSTATAGVQVALGCADVLVEKNRIHGMFDAQPTSTSAFSGIYMAGKGKPTMPNKVINNAIYDINSSGPIYGINNSAGDTMLAYHNTIVFDNANGAGTSTIVGLYQSQAASGIEFKNNVVAITRASTGLKRCFYFSTSASNIVSDYNLVYLKSAGANNKIGTCNSVDYVTLANWQASACAAFDTHSIDTNPLFTGVSSSNFIPGAAFCDDKGTPVGVTTDLLEKPRSSTTPDIGAFEIIIQLPVKLIDFKGSKYGSSNLLSWTTITELNNTGFELQRSSNGRDFTKIGFIATKADNGNSGAVINYSFEDNNPLAGTCYYRLKQIDKDGKYSYSSVVLLTGNKGSIFEIVNAYPNPVISNLNLVVNATKDETVEMVVTDIVGKIIYRTSKPATKGLNNISINTQSLSAGTYIIKALCANGCESKAIKFVKE